MAFAGARGGMALLVHQDKDAKGQAERAAEQRHAPLGWRRTRSPTGLMPTAQKPANWGDA